MQASQAMDQELGREKRGGARGRRRISSKAAPQDQGQSNNDVDVKEQSCVSGHLRSTDVDSKEGEDRSEACLPTTPSQALRYVGA